MTREDANKRILLACKRTWNEKTCKEIFKALEQEPCEDAISRQALLDDFGFSEKTRKWGGDHSGYNTMMLYEIQDMIESAPSVNPQHSGDLINRQDAIKAIDEKAKRIKNEDTLNGLAGAVGILFDLPSVKPQEMTDENLHREREQSYMQGYEDASKRFRHIYYHTGYQQALTDVRQEIYRHWHEEPCVVEHGCLDEIITIIDKCGGKQHG